MLISVSLGGGYDIIIERGALSRASSLLDLDRRVCVVTDDGVPPQYAETIASQCALPVIYSFRAGESGKSLDNYEKLLTFLLANGFTRTDCIVAVGGGVVGDLAGFAAATYMRGIDFYNVPTTVLSQVDASIGGKTAVNLAGAKNIVGAFYQPKRVLIDGDVLVTLCARQVSNGLAEAVKMALTSDADLFSFMEKTVADGTLDAHLDEIIMRALTIKKMIVEQDEKEAGLRRILNFGHTIGHAIESAEALRGLYHGECVALGMQAMCEGGVKARLLPVLAGLGLPTSLDFDKARVYEAIKHDKKADGGDIHIVTVKKIGECIQTKVPIAALKDYIDRLAR